MLPVVAFLKFPVIIKWIINETRLECTNVSNILADWTKHRNLLKKQKIKKTKQKKKHCPNRSQTFQSCSFHLPSGLISEKQQQKNGLKKSWRKRNVWKGICTSVCMFIFPASYSKQMSHLLRVHDARQKWYREASLWNNRFKLTVDKSSAFIALLSQALIYCGDAFLLTVGGYLSSSSCFDLLINGCFFCLFSHRSV